MAKDKKRMPSGQGGLVQYHEADTGFDIDPKTVIGFTLTTGIMVISLHMGLFV